MTPAQKAKRTLTLIEIPRDELALVIAQACIGYTPPGGFSATKILDDMDRIPQLHGGPPMGHSFRAAADNAVAFFHAQIQKGVQPS